MKKADAITVSSPLRSLSGANGEDSGRSFDRQRCGRRAGALQAQVSPQVHFGPQVQGRHEQFLLEHLRHVFSPCLSGHSDGSGI
jgi:hypothetical protein